MLGFVCFIPLFDGAAALSKAGIHWPSCPKLALGRDTSDLARTRAVSLHARSVHDRTAHAERTLMMSIPMPMAVREPVAAATVLSVDRLASTNVQDEREQSDYAKEEQGHPRPVGHL